MLVAVPSAIAFGVTIYSPLGGSYAAQGALAGILGTTALGIVASALGGTQRLISAPCAPAAAVMSALAMEFAGQDMDPQAAVLMLMLVAFMCGLMQVAFGAVRLGRLIKYMPYPVVSGYLSGVGLVIIVNQVPKFLGVPKDTHFWVAVTSPSLWNGHGVAVGAVTAAVMLTAPKFTKAVPAAILGLGGGVLTYFGLALTDASLLELAGNKLVVGPHGSTGDGFITTMTDRWKGFVGLNYADLAHLVMPAFTLAVLLSIDTLKTCVVLDALTRTRHDSNRELIGQGFGNVTSTLIGGVPGAGQMGATLVNMSSGGQSRLSSMIEGGLALTAFLLLGGLVAWVPITALAAILIVIGCRMFDLHSLNLLRSRSTILDFAVIVAVIVVAKTVSLIMASAVGIGLAIILFIREQIGGSVVRRMSHGNQMFSKQVRLPEEMALLEKLGDQSIIFELQGSLFFGTADQLYTALDPELKRRKYIILDMRRVQSVDVTAAHILELIIETCVERKAFLLLSHLPRRLPSGRDIQQYLGEVGLMKHESHARIFGELDEALEWVENRILDEAMYGHSAEDLLALKDIALFKGRKEETLAALEACMEKRSFLAGEKIFARGDTGDEVYFIRRGTVRIMLPLDGRQGHHLATFGRGDFFGEMSFLDRATRSADALAYTDTELYVLSRGNFDVFAEYHKKVGMRLMEALARVLAGRLRYMNAELRALEES